MELAWYREHRMIVRLLAVVIPLLAAAGLYLIPDVVAKSAAALVLVLIVVAAASTGDRLSGMIAAVSAAVGFDVFLIQPYLTLRIDSAEDVELAVLLLLVGGAVSELASWGIRQSASATEQSGFVRGALESAALAAGSADEADALPRIAEAIGKVLRIEGITFEYGDHDAGAGVIQPDGTLRYQGKVLDVALAGLPHHPYAYTALPVARNGGQVGYFKISTPNQDIRPTREQLQVAVLLAGQWSLRVQAPRARGH